MKMTQDLVLVTGAASYLGLHVVNRLLKYNHKVRGTIRNLDQREKVQALFLLENSEQNLEVIEADLLDETCWDNVMKNVSIVIHCASPHPKKRPDDETKVIRPAVEGTWNVLKAAHNSQTVQRFVLTSAAVSIMGYNREECEYSEDDFADPNKHHGYVKSKILSERLAWEFVNKKQPNCFELVVINPAFLLGPTFHLEGTDTGTSEARIVDLFTNDKIPRFNFAVCDVRDAALALCKVAFLPQMEGKRFLVASRSEFISMKEIVKIIQDELSGLSLNIPTREETSGYLSQSKVNIRRMKDELKIEPIKIKKTICDMIFSLIDNGFIKI